jgi:uncharacterized protein YdiU (UPF0061 family)
MTKMWADKLGIKRYNAALFKELTELMIETSVDYTIFFRELSSIPTDITPLQKSFYKDISSDKKLIAKWREWLEEWRTALKSSDTKALSKQLKSINPKYTLREWHLVPAYEQADIGNYEPLRMLQEIMANPYDEQSEEIEAKYYRPKPAQLFNVAGISHVSCSS